MVEANYGTQIPSDTSTYGRPATAPTWDSGTGTWDNNPDGALISTVAYDAAGNAVQTRDNAGRLATSLYDDAGRVIQTVQNYVPGGSAADQNLTTAYNYEAGVQLCSMTVTANDPLGGSATTETTQYVYGTDVSDNGTAASPLIYSNDLLRAVIYSDSSNTFTQPAYPGDPGNLIDTGGYNRVEYTYDRQGEVTSVEDQNQTVHTYGYDNLGREISDTASWPNGNPYGVANSGNAATEIDESYTALGQPYQVTSSNQSGSLNQVQLAYNDMGQVQTEYQEHLGNVNTATSLYTQYSYAGAANGYRLASIQYPESASQSGSRQVNFSYGATGSTDAAINRLSAITDSSGTLASYQYLGLDTMVSENYQAAGVQLDYFGAGDPTGASHQYSGLDRFNRVIDQVWQQYGSGGVTDVTGLADEFKYGYTSAGDVAWKDNVTADMAGQAFDEVYAYDGLDRLKDYLRGTLDMSGYPESPPTFENSTEDAAQYWTLSGMGTWDMEQTYNGHGFMIDLGSYGDANQLLEMDNALGDPTWAIPQYDNAGNATVEPRPTSPMTGLTCKYDAWNRLVEVDNGATVLAQYAYDGLGRKIEDFTYSGGTSTGVTHYYYGAGEVIETRVTGSATADPAGVAPQYQYVWSGRVMPRSSATRFLAPTRASVFIT